MDGNSTLHFIIIIFNTYCKLFGSLEWNQLKHAFRLNHILCDSHLKQFRPSPSYPITMLKDSQQSVHQGVTRTGEDEAAGGVIGAPHTQAESQHFARIILKSVEFEGEGNLVQQLNWQVQVRSVFVISVQLQLLKLCSLKTFRHNHSDLFAVEIHVFKLNLF